MNTTLFKYDFMKATYVVQQFVIVSHELKLLSNCTMDTFVNKHFFSNRFMERYEVLTPFNASFVGTLSQLLIVPYSCYLKFYLS